jgi:hypothetical protein
MIKALFVKKDYEVFWLELETCPTHVIFNNLNFTCTNVFGLKIYIQR